MESSGDTAAALQYSSTSPTPPPLQPTTATGVVVLSPCAACKILHRRCVDRCVLAPYFPPTEPHKFDTAHRVFGASNIINLQQKEHRADAVSSMVYEAGAQIRDPVYGCAGAIYQLQRQVNDLMAQLARAQAELTGARAQLVGLLCMEVAAVGAGAPPPAAYCASQSSSQLAIAPAALADVLCVVVDGAGAPAGIMQASPVGWADDPLWT